ncbi:MAG: hypothetical protein J6J58_08485, partial [Oscillospiraceae bacterium]|nr:hypothetical protein [Oscillospiraceae bacterium]
KKALKSVISGLLALFWPKKQYKNKKPTSFGCRFVGALEGTRRLCLWQILPGLAWSARLLQLKTVYHTVFYTLQPSRVLVPHHNKQKKPTPKWVLAFMVRWKGLEPLTP